MYGHVSAAIKNDVDCVYIYLDFQLLHEAPKIFLVKIICLANTLVLQTPKPQFVTQAFWYI